MKVYSGRRATRRLSSMDRGANRTMPELRTCRRCGIEIPEQAPFGHCPKCLMEVGLTPLPEEPTALPSPLRPEERSFGDYELLEPLGRGGMGVVYKARQRSLNRTVALKMIRAEAFASSAVVQRFAIEAEAAASLQHPNIVPIFEVGEFQGVHFYSMKLIEGPSLEKQIAPGGFRVSAGIQPSEASPRETQMTIARIVAIIGRAVHYAH